jgi:hypothetical protein
MFANSLNKKVDFFWLVSFRKFDRRNFHFQAIGLPAFKTFEVNMVVMMSRLPAGLGA